MGQPSLTDKKKTNVEIEVAEHYGALPNAVNSTLHLWHAEGKHWAKRDFITAPGLTDDFHTYGVLVDEANIVWYFDGVEIQRQKTPEEAKVPLYLLVKLAMGGGWPIDQAVTVLYVRGVHAGLRQAPVTSANPIRRFAGLLPKVGLEPTPPCGDRILSPARLPFRHFGAGRR